MKTVKRVMAINAGSVVIASTCAFFELSVLDTLFVSPFAGALLGIAVWKYIK